MVSKWLLEAKPLFELHSEECTTYWKKKEIIVFIGYFIPVSVMSILSLVLKEACIIC